MKDTIIGDMPCPNCRKNGRDSTGNHLIIFSPSGNKACNKCGYKEIIKTNTPRTGEEDLDLTTLEDIEKLPFAPLLARKISAEESSRYRVRVEYDPITREEVNYYFPIYVENTLKGFQRKAAKIPGSRGKGDVSRTVVNKGDTKGALPFGSHLVGTSGKFLLVTEGGEDCLAASQMIREQIGKNWRVVATLGADAWSQNTEYFKGFDKVAIAFDPDDEGTKQARKFAEALGTRAVIVQLPADPNQMLLEGRGREFLQCINSAKPYSPAGILYGEAVWDRMKNYVKPETYSYPSDWSDFVQKAEGIRMGEISLWTGGSSIGKTSYVRRLKQHFLATTDLKIGEVELEEAPEKTFRGLMQFFAGKRWHEMSSTERREVFEQTYGTERIFTLDHRAHNKDGSSIMAKLYHLHYAMGCRLLWLDHITIAVNEFGEGNGGLADQDQMMNEMLTFVEKTNSHLAIISHLRKPPGGGKDWEQGLVPTKGDLKGSGSLQQISFDIFGVSRNMVHEDPYERNVSQIHVLKCRETGRTGPADRMFWDESTQSLIPAKQMETF